MKTHEFIAPVVLLGLASFKLPAGKARALPAPPGLSWPPLRVDINKRGETRNVKGLSAAARLWRASVGDPTVPLAPAIADAHAWFAAEAAAHQGPETNCPEPHRSFYYNIVTLIRQVAARLDHLPLLAATGNWLGAERVMLEAFDGPGGVWGCMFRADPKSSIDLSQATWMLGFLRTGKPPSRPKLPAEVGMVALGSPTIAQSPLASDLINITALPVHAPLHLGTPIRVLIWPGALQTTQMDATKMPASPVFPVIWTSVDLKTGARVAGRDGEPPTALGVPRETVLGGAWRGPK